MQINLLVVYDFLCCFLIYVGIKKAKECFVLKVKKICCNYSRATRSKMWEVGLVFCVLCQ